MALNMEIAEIITSGLAHGESYALINSKLMEKGCEFRLVHVKKVVGPRPDDYATPGSNWTNREMAEGFREPGDEVYSPEDVNAPIYDPNKEEN